MSKIKRRDTKLKNDSYSREEILSVLQKINPIISSNVLKNEFSKFIFTGDSLISSNNEMGICCPLKTKFKCTIEPKGFDKILSSIQDKEIKIEQKENKLLLSAKNISAEIIVDKDIDKDIVNTMGIIPLSGQVRKKKITEDFMTGIEFSLISITRNMGEVFLTCAYINDDKIISTDDYRISVYNLDKGIGSKILLRSSLIEVIASYKNIIGYYINFNWIYFFTEDNIILCSRIVEEKFPDVEKEFDFDAKEISLPDDFSYLVKNASILASGEFDIDKKIEVKISKGKISCKGQNDLGWIESKIEIDTKQNFTFSINPIFLLQILKKTNKMKFGEGKILFETDKFKHLIGLYIEE